MQFIRGSTEANYIVWTKSHHVTSRTVTIPWQGTKAFWIGDPDATTTMLYFHGGGWGLPGSSGHFSFVSSLVSTAAASGKSLAVLVLQHDLAPNKQYPHQLTQCVELLRYTVMDLHKSPDQIVLGGDSAGGNMVFGVLSHLLHPHPAIEPLKLSAALRACFVASPVASLNAEFANELQDPAPASTIKVWFENYLGCSARDSWNDPSKTDVAWWSEVDEVVKQILMTVATNEMMATDTQDFAAKLKATSHKLTLFAAKDDFHAEPVIGPDLGFGEGEASCMIKSWVVERL
ncbi:hypothetical protein MMC19_002933 [Ptychographa xylographoides]|nr:hypothetical protein [Ptychographa xylographoides]